jgi:hypothetical protein
MANNALVLLANNFKSWVSARGFIMVVAAALVPLILTGSWVATHQTDVASDNVTWDKDNPVQGDLLNITATITNKGRFDVGPFNATLTVGRVSNTATGVRLITDRTNLTQIPGLESGESTTIRLNWTATSANFYVVIAEADTANVLAEIEEFNNQKPVWLEVGYRPPAATDTPNARTSLGGTPSSPARADLAIVNLVSEPAAPRPGDNVTYTATVRNDGPDAVTDANVTLQIGSAFSRQVFPSREAKMNVTLAPGETTNVTLRFNSITVGNYWLEAFVNTTGVAYDANDANNWMTRWAPVQPRLGPDAAFPNPPERLTIKRFYVDILEGLHIRILLPLIGLFYAAGVISDEKEKGNLVYVLTRPVARPLIPVLKFVASFLVASVAVVAGILATFFLLLGTPEGQIGFLTTPLLISLISLFVYGSFFILLGVLVDRPYLIGLGWVIGWETIAGNFVPWVRNITLSHHLLNAINGWRLDDGLQWLPESDEAKLALAWVMGAAIVFLLASVVVMRRREFDL